MDDLAQQFDELAKFDEQQRRETDDWFKWQAIVRENSDAWNHLPESFTKWLIGVDELGAEFSHFLIHLHEIAEQRYGKDCFQRVAGFKAANYKPSGDFLVDRNKTDVWRVAVSVEFLLRCLCQIGIFVKDVSGMMEILDGEKDCFGKFDEHSKKVIANATRNVQNVIQRGEPNARCRDCNAPLELGRYHHATCQACDAGHGKKQEIQEQLTRIWDELRPLESMTKVQAIGTGRTVEQWINAAWNWYHRLSYLCEPALINRQKAIDNALAIAELIGTEHAAEKLSLVEWQVVALQLYSRLLASALNQDEQQTKKLLWELLEFNSAALDDSERLGKAPINELLGMIGITLGNVYGAGGTFNGQLPTEWYKSSTTVEPTGPAETRTEIGPLTEERDDKGKASDVLEKTPNWDKERMVLSFDGIVVRQFSRTASNCFSVLDTFQELGWPNRIDCPLKGGTPEKRGQTAVSLNKKMVDPSPIKFSRDGKGTGFCWNLSSTSQAQL